MEAPLLTLDRYQPALHPFEPMQHCNYLVFRITEFVKRHKIAELQQGAMNLLPVSWNPYMDRFVKYYQGPLDPEKYQEGASMITHFIENFPSSTETIKKVEALVASTPYLLLAYQFKTRGHGFYTNTIKADDMMLGVYLSKADGTNIKDDPRHPQNHELFFINVSLWEKGIEDYATYLSGGAELTPINKSTRIRFKGNFPQEAEERCCSCAIL